MKNFIYGIILAFIGVLLLWIILTVNGRLTREKESTDSLGQVVETAVENTIEQDNYTIDSNEEFVADFTQNLLTMIENNADIEVKIAGVDYVKGLLSVEVIEHFEHPNSRDTQISYATTVILEKAVETQYYNIEFYDDKGELLKKYTLVENTKIPQIKVMDTNRTIKGWKDENGQSVNINNITADRDKKFYAVY